METTGMTPKKMNMDFDNFKTRILKIMKLYPKSEIHLCKLWLRKIRDCPDEDLRSQYALRMYSEILSGYLCYPFSKEPNSSPLQPLPTPHLHSSPQSSVSDLTSLDSCLTLDQISLATTVNDKIVVVSEAHGQDHDYEQCSEMRRQDNDPNDESTRNFLAMEDDECKGDSFESNMNEPPVMKKSVETIDEQRTQETEMEIASYTLGELAKCENFIEFQVNSDKNNDDSCRNSNSHLELTSDETVKCRKSFFKMSDIIEEVSNENEEEIEIGKDEQQNNSPEIDQEAEQVLKSCECHIEDIKEKLTDLLNVSNKQNEKLETLDVKFNLMKNDYELERKEMILKFRSIDDLHQQILSELIKRQMNESKQFQNLVEHYRAQFNRKNEEIAKLKSNLCQKCTEVNTVNEMGDNNEEIKNNEEIQTVTNLNEEIRRLKQDNKDLIYKYEMKLRKVLNEKNLENKLFNALIQAQKHEIEVYLTNQKHNEMRKLAEQLEYKYSRIINDKVQQAESQHKEHIGKIVELEMKMSSTKEE